MAFRREYLDALELLGEASEKLAKQGLSPPIIVGGAAVEYYTGAAIMTGDFDIVCAADQSLKDILVGLGFREENRQGHLLRGLYHPDLLMAVEIVSGALFDGRADRDRLAVIRLEHGREVLIASIEDMIADRMGQYASSPRGAFDMLKQAMILLQLAENVDEPYLEERILAETLGQYDLDFLREKTDARSSQAGRPEPLS